MKKPERKGRLRTKFKKTERAHLYLVIEETKKYEWKIHLYV